MILLTMPLSDFSIKYGGFKMMKTFSTSSLPNSSSFSSLGIDSTKYAYSISIGGKNKLDEKRIKKQIQTFIFDNICFYFKLIGNLRTMAFNLFIFFSLEERFISTRITVNLDSIHLHYSSNFSKDLFTIPNFHIKEILAYDS